MCDSFRLLFFFSSSLARSRRVDATRLYNPLAAATRVASRLWTVDTPWDAPWDEDLWLFSMTDRRVQVRPCLNKELNHCQ